MGESALLMQFLWLSAAPGLSCTVLKCQYLIDYDLGKGRVDWSHLELNVRNNSDIPISACK